MSESKTHGPGCWEDPEHGECARIQARAAINHIHNLQREIAAEQVAREKAEAERDALAARVAEALSAVQDVLEAAYHRCYQSCCGRPGMECCGSPIQTWTADDEHIMETLGPVEKSLRAALSREEKS